MKMAFNGCDTDGPHNKRLCMGQNVNDNNNNTNGGLCSSPSDVEMKTGHSLIRVNWKCLLWRYLLVSIQPRWSAFGSFRNSRCKYPPAIGVTLALSANLIAGQSIRTIARYLCHVRLSTSGSSKGTNTLNLSIYCRALISTLVSCVRLTHRSIVAVEHDQLRLLIGANYTRPWFTGNLQIREVLSELDVGCDCGSVRGAGPSSLQPYFEYLQLVQAGPTLS
jgi:hypothetical protein